jgi:hypothetical protein
MSLIDIAKREILSARKQAARMSNATLPPDRIIFHRQRFAELDAIIWTF